MLFDPRRRVIMWPMAKATQNKMHRLFVVKERKMTSYNKRNYRNFGIAKEETRGQNVLN